MKPEETDPEQLLAELRAITMKIPFFDGSGTPSRLDAEQILGELAAIRNKIPFLGEGTPRQSEDTRTNFIEDIPIETEEDFEWAAVLEAIESLHDDLTSGIERQKAAIVEKALDIYYATEEASRDPANAHLIELVEQMRVAYARENGRPIPPKGKK